VLFTQKGKNLSCGTTTAQILYPPRLLPISPPHRVRHVGNLLTVPHIHGTMVLATMTRGR
jgi:hypothetical protein